MKKMLTGAFILLLGVGAAQAQTTPNAKQKGQQKEHRMSAYKNLSLSAGQQASLKTINEDFRQKKAVLNAQTTLSDAEMNNRKKALKQEHKAALKTVLTAEQKAQLKKIRAKGNKGDRERKEYKNSNAGKGAQFAKTLNLTAVQQTKMQEIKAGYRPKLKALRNDKTLAPDQKREKLKALRQSQQAEMKTVLTKEQAEKMQLLRQERAARHTKK